MSFLRIILYFALNASILNAAAAEMCQIALRKCKPQTSEKNCSKQEKIRYFFVGGQSEFRESAYEFFVKTLHSGFFNTQSRQLQTLPSSLQMSDIVH